MTTVQPNTSNAPEGTPLDHLRAEWSGELRSHGRRVTKQRLAVLSAVHQNQHSPAEDIVEYVRGELPNITVQSVYVVLADLTEIELLRKFQPPSTPALYETRASDNHHHALCVVCGRVEDVDCAVGEAPCLAPSDAHGMTIIAADVVYRGICADCQSERAETNANGPHSAASAASPHLSGLTTH
ncbi:Fur family transcriptional regulator [Rothia uropygialis]|uniref:Fur family transcriptional regulator n=1 Tax=Kocuria sp. 36 TaxID=1415402 RepID=UPI00101C6655|nr:Fur family transcriptional regulator [Kocuria sp. 36]